MRKIDNIRLQASEAIPVDSCPHNGVKAGRLCRASADTNAEFSGFVSEASNAEGGIRSADTCGFVPAFIEARVAGKIAKRGFISGLHALVFLLVLCLSLSPVNIEKSLAQDVKKEATKTKAGQSAASKSKPSKNASAKSRPVKSSAAKSGSSKTDGKKASANKKAKAKPGKGGSKVKVQKSTQPAKSAQAAKKSKSRSVSRADDTSSRNTVPASKPAKLSSPLVASPELFARPVQARVYKFRDSNSDWLLPNESPESVGKALAALRPSLVSSLALFYNGALPGEDELDSLSEIRRKVAQVSPDAKFELVLDARDYKNPDELTSHMRALAERVDFELFFFSGLESVYERNPAIATAAIAEAHAQNRLAGAMFHSKAVPQLDYVAVYGGDGEENLQRRIAGAQTRLPILATMDNESQKLQLDKNYAGGKDFVSKKVPAERRKLVTSLAKKQDSLGFRLAYPLFFPLQTASKSYDALRDEFMRDTLRRLAEEHNNKPGKVALKAVLD